MWRKYVSCALLHEVYTDKTGGHVRKSAILIRNFVFTLGHFAVYLFAKGHGELL